VFLRFWVEAEVNFFRRENFCRRDYLDYLKNRAKSGDMDVLLLTFRNMSLGKCPKIDAATGVMSHVWTTTRISRVFRESFDMSMHVSNVRTWRASLGSFKWAFLWVMSHTYEWVMSPCMNASRHAHVRHDSKHYQMALRCASSHVSHIWISHVSHLNESCLAPE